MLHIIADKIFINNPVDQHEYGWKYFVAYFQYDSRNLSAYNRIILPVIRTKSVTRLSRYAQYNLAGE